MAQDRARPIAAALLCLFATTAMAQSDAPQTAPGQSWSFDGFAGSIDRAASRRGFQVYSESCSNCHAMDMLHYRDLSGIGFTGPEIKAIAGKIMLPAGFDSHGKPLTKPATPSSAFQPPFPDEDAARAANNGALPPDLSLASNAFADGPNHIYAVLTGYRDPPAGAKLADGMSWNIYFPGHQIAMPPPLSEGQFTYPDGTKSTVDQNARDVVTFLAWAANPEAAQRKRLGFRVVGYFALMAGLTYALERRAWRKVL